MKITDGWNTFLRISFVSFDIFKHNNYFLNKLFFFLFFKIIFMIKIFFILIWCLRCFIVYFYLVQFLKLVSVKFLTKSLKHLFTNSFYFLFFFFFFNLILDALSSRHLLHVTYKLYLLSLIAECLSLFFLTCYYGLYASDGIERHWIKLIGKYLISILINDHLLFLKFFKSQEKL